MIEFLSLSFISELATSLIKFLIIYKFLEISESVSFGLQSLLYIDPVHYIFLNFSLRASHKYKKLQLLKVMNL